MSKTINFTVKHWSKASNYGASSPAWSRYYVSDADGNSYGFFYVKRKWDDDSRVRFEYPEYVELNGDEDVLSAIAESVQSLRDDYIGEGPAETWAAFKIMMGLSYLAAKPFDKKAKERQERFSTVTV